MDANRTTLHAHQVVLLPFLPNREFDRPGGGDDWPTLQYVRRVSPGAGLAHRKRLHAEDRQNRQLRSVASEAHATRSPGSRSSCGLHATTRMINARARAIVRLDVLP